MAETSGFFRSVSGDRKYSTDWLAKWVSSFIGSGVYNGELALSPGGGMSVTLPVGKAWINGYYYCNDAPITLPIANADGVLHRKDTIVLRWNVNERSITTRVLQGSFASNPIAPEIARDLELYDLKLAEISIPAGTTAITPALITDTRLDKAVCGIVTGVVNQVDTTTFYNQIAADLAQFKSTQQTDFEAWFDNVKDILDESTAGNLLNLINSHTADTTAHMTQAQKNQLAVAIQSATIGGAAVTKNGTTLQLPAYPTTLPANGGLSANTTSIASALTVSTSAPSYYIGAGKIWGVY
ncbi:hypothetical protein [Clostridium merdae]|uniref:hypothetical protein n=1 Tax=Clostridium merdae TaxID=1958780 RepID=UPI000A26A799|nr:hypothetical protein [Clostridium merdae]